MVGKKGEKGRAIVNALLLGGCLMCCLKLAVGEAGLRVELCTITISLVEFYLQSFSSSAALVPCV